MMRRDTPSQWEAAQELETERPRVLLDGRWQFSYDPEDIGVKARWYAPATRLPERVNVPGCSQARRYRSSAAGENPFEGLPELSPGVLLRYPSQEPSWWKRTFRVPAGWRDREMWLHVGGVMPAASFWINGRPAGQTDTSRTAVRCRVTNLLHPGQPNHLAARIHWPDLRLGGLFDGLCAWSGLYRSAWVEATPAVHVCSIHVRPTIQPTVAHVTAVLRSAPRTPTRLVVACSISDRYGAVVSRHEQPVRVTGRTRSLSAQLPVPGADLWEPDSPHLYEATVELLQDGVPVDSASTRFGFREIATQGSRVLLNGQPVFLRGGCDDHFYPETVCPPADKAFFVARLHKAKRYGFNYTKSCVEVFTREFLEAADEVGYLVCEEMPFFDRQARKNPTAAARKLWQRELRSIIKSDRNHPSVVVYSMSSELNSKWLRNATAFRFFSRDLPATARRLNPSALVFDATGVNTSPDPDYGRRPVPVVTESGRRDTDLQGSWLKWTMEGGPLDGPIPGIEDATLPFFLHEFAWITSLTDPGLAERYRGLPVRPLHVPDMLAAAEANGLTDELPRMFTASRKLKYEFLKYSLELARRSPKVAGYHQWLIHDFPFCAEGVLNEFWEEPAGYPPEWFMQCNADTVLLLNDVQRRCFTFGKAPPLAVTVSHFGPEPLAHPVLRWTLRRGGRRAAAGEVAMPRVACGTLRGSGDLGIRIPGGRRPVRFDLNCMLLSGDRTVCGNGWALWGFPPPAPDAGARARGHSVRVVDTFDDATLDVLADGGRVLFLAEEPADGPAGDLPRSPGAPLYRTVPYNHGTVGNMGTTIAAHPVTDALPHEGWCDLYFAPLIQGAHPFALDVYRPHRIRPIIRSIGHMRTMHDKAYLFELAVGRGRLMACSLRLREAQDRTPAAAYVLERMLEYMEGDELRPAPRVSPRKLRETVRGP